MSLDSKEKLQKKLQEIFQFDSDDLDFGIYKIFKQKKDDITDFIEKILPEEISKQLSRVTENKKKDITQELEKTKTDLEELQVPLENNPIYQQLKQELESLETSPIQESNIYNYIYNFFSRYYDKGDFIGRRRYGDAEKYLIPSRGEETLLHWATYDQYYVKNTDLFRKFSFIVDGYTVNFKMIEVEEEAGNGKELKKYFILNPDPKCEQKDHEIDINFRHRSLNSADKGKIPQSQPEIDKITLAEISSALKLPSGVKESIRTNLRKYTLYNTSDYFIHKHLKDFLDRELDFYVKNEVLDFKNPRGSMFIADVILQICSTVNDFLGQLENFQLRIWEKKKFVLKTDYVFARELIVDNDLDVEVEQNQDQRTEWEELFELKGKTNEELKKLPVDTKHFPPEFKETLLEKLTKKCDLDDSINGLLINSENFQALNLLTERFRNQAKCIYIDPPYNTGSDEFLYKDNYQHSSWLSLLKDRIVVAKELLKDEGTLAVSIDINEIDELLKLLDLIFGPENRRAIMTIERGSGQWSKINPGVAAVTEYLVVYSKDKPKWYCAKLEVPQNRMEFAERTRYQNFITNPTADCSKWKIISTLQAFADERKIAKDKVKKELGANFLPSFAEFLITHATSVIRWAPLTEGDISKEANKIRKKSIIPKNKDTIYDTKTPNYQYIKNGEKILYLADKVKNNEVMDDLTDIWTDVKNNDLAKEGAVTLLKGKKSEKLLKRIIELFTCEGDLVIDFFAGTGTTASVAHQLKRKYVNVEMAGYFGPKLLKRMKNTIFGEGLDDNGKVQKIGDVTYNGGGIFKYQQLEQYEDALENIIFSQNGPPGFSQVGSDYFVKYMFGKETEASKTFLNIDDMKDPFKYKIKFLENNQQDEVEADLIETYNYLIGLKMQKFRIFNNKSDNDTKYVVIDGKIDSKEIVIIWRDTSTLNQDKDKDFIKQNILQQRYDEIHINGSCAINCELIEQKFKTMMERKLI